MKRADLVAGQEYLCNSQTDWSTRSYNNERVTVLMTEPVVHERWNSKASVTLPDGSKVEGFSLATHFDVRTQVLVLRSGADYPALVNLTALRGPWGPLNTEVRDRERRNQEAALKAQRERTERLNQSAQKTREIANRVWALGLPRPRTKVVGAQYEVVVTTDLLVNLLDIIDNRDPELDLGLGR